jgi:hypothetical protein
MTMVEESYVKDDITYFKRVWKCCHHEWWHIFKWDDLDAATYSPICRGCLNGSLFVS